MSDGTKKNINVEYVAALARLKLEEDKKSRIQREMETILEYVDLLNDLDLSGIEPTAYASPTMNVWRDDIPAESFSRETMLSNAAETIDGRLVRVPPVIPGEEES